MAVRSMYITIPIMLTVPIKVCSIEETAVRIIAG